MSSDIRPQERVIFITFHSGPLAIPRPGPVHGKRNNPISVITSRRGKWFAFVSLALLAPSPQTTLPFTAIPTS